MSNETGGAQTIPQETEYADKKLGRLPAKRDTRDLLFARYFAPVDVPKMYRPWKGRKAFPLDAFHNDIEGNCTRASQAIAHLRLERLEQRRTISISRDEVTRVYREMTARLYGGGDTGAYETDALSEWRRPETTFRDARGRPLTIDAYTRVNVADLDEVRAAIFAAGGRVFKFCANMPLAWRGQNERWDAPADGVFIGNWLAGSWGGHSMTGTDGYDEDGIYVQTWDDPPRLITWKGFAAYVDEMHVPIDAVNAWKKRLARGFDAKRLVRDVNEVSATPIAA